MEPIDYRGALTRGWRLMLVLGLIGLVVGLLLPSSSTTVWTSTSQLGAVPAPTLSDGSSPLSTGVPTDQIIFFANSDQVIAAAGRLAGLNKNTAVLRDRIRVTGPATNASGVPTGQAGVVSIQAQGPTQNDSVSLNRAFAFALDTKINAEANQELKAQQMQVYTQILTVQKQLNSQTDQAGVTATALENELTALETKQAQLALETPSTGITILEDASHATKSSTPLIDSRPLRGLAGLLIGVLLGAAVALVVSLFDKRLRTATRAGEAFGYPVVAEIHDQSVQSSETYRMLALAVLTEPLASRARDGGAVDDYELMYDQLELAASGVGGGDTAPATSAGPPDPSAPPSDSRRVVLVTSPGREPSRAVVGASLATSCAESGRSVVVISTGSIPTDGQHAYTRPVAVDPAEVAALLEETSVPGVSVLPIERLAAHSSQLMSVAPGVIAALRDLVDLVIFDVPPLLTVHHGEGLVPMVDVVVVVAEYRLTTADHLRRSGALLERLSAPVSGLVFTNVPVRGQTFETSDHVAYGEGSDQVLTGEANVVDEQLVSVSTNAEANESTRGPSANLEGPHHDGDADPQS